MLNNLNNSANPTSFKATLKVNIPVNNSARLQNIKKLFSEQTKDMKDILSISKVDTDEYMECFHTGVKADNSIITFFEDKFETMMDKLSDNELVTKMIKTLKSIKILNRREHSLLDIDGNIYKTKNEQERNLLIASNLRKKGNITMAERFEFLANCFEKKIDKIQAEQKKLDESTLAKITKIADGDSDIVKLYYCS